MDLTWPLFIVILIASGLWAKYQNTKHIRKMREAYKKEFES